MVISTAVMGMEGNCHGKGCFVGPAEVIFEDVLPVNQNITQVRRAS
jgi:hypothetical protein